MKKKPIKIIAIILSFVLFFQQTGLSQVAGQLDISSYLAVMRNSFIQEKFRPIHLRFMEYDPASSNFQLLLDKENLKGLTNSAAEKATEKLLEYFLVGVSLPNDAFWVNLRPDTPDNIIDPLVGQTDVGRIFLEADVQLKKDTAAATSPETTEGKEYWDKLYLKAEEIFGSQNVTIPTLTRPWIVPDEIIIRETSQNAYIYKATLKVMLEQDYLAQSKAAGVGVDYSFKDERLKKLNEYSTELLKEKIIPRLTKEINTSKRYAQLRQVYYSLILAQWFKKKFYGTNSFYSSLINRKNLAGLTSKQSWDKEEYFRQYQKSFKAGEYNFKIPQQTIYGKVIRSYFSGGIALGDTSVVSQVVTPGNTIPVPSTLSSSSPRLNASRGVDGENGVMPKVTYSAPSPAPAGDSATSTEDSKLNIHIAKFDFDSSDVQSWERYNTLLSVSKDLITNISREELLAILRNISGIKDLGWGDLSSDVELSYFSEGAHKYVYKVQFSLASGEKINILLAAKKEINKKDITSHELNNLKKLNGRGVPKFAWSGVSSDGRRWYIEEFIEGETAKELMDKGSLTQRMRRSIVATLLTIAVGLGGMAPRDMHGGNFIIRKGTDEAVMVDIGDNRLYIGGKAANPQHKLLFLAMLMSQHGFKSYNALERDNFIFEEILNHRGFSKDAAKLLEDVFQLTQSMSREEIKSLFVEKGRNMFWNLGGTVSNEQPLIEFIEYFINSLNAFMAKTETRRGPPSVGSEEGPRFHKINGRVVGAFDPVSGKIYYDFQAMRAQMPQVTREQAINFLYMHEAYHQLLRQLGLLNELNLTENQEEDLVNGLAKEKARIPLNGREQGGVDAFRANSRVQALIIQEDASLLFDGSIQDTMGDFMLTLYRVAPGVAFENLEAAEFYKDGHETKLLEDLKSRGEGGVRLLNFMETGFGKWLGSLFGKRTNEDREGFEDEEGDDEWEDDNEEEAPNPPAVNILPQQNQNLALNIPEYDIIPIDHRQFDYEELNNQIFGHFNIDMHDIEVNFIKIPKESLRLMKEMADQTIKMENSLKPLSESAVEVILGLSLRIRLALFRFVLFVDRKLDNLLGQQKLHPYGVSVLRLIASSLASSVHKAAAVLSAENSKGGSLTLRGVLALYELEKIADLRNRVSLFGAYKGLLDSAINALGESLQALVTELEGMQGSSSIANYRRARLIGIIGNIYLALEGSLSSRVDLTTDNKIASQTGFTDLEVYSVLIKVLQGIQGEGSSANYLRVSVARALSGMVITKKTATASLIVRARVAEAINSAMNEILSAIEKTTGNDEYANYARVNLVQALESIIMQVKWSEKTREDMELARWQNGQQVVLRAIGILYRLLQNTEADTPQSNVLRAGIASALVKISEVASISGVDYSYTQELTLALKKSIPSLIQALSRIKGSNYLQQNIKDAICGALAELLQYSPEAIKDLSALKDKDFYEFMKEHVGTKLLNLGVVLETLRVFNPDFAQGKEHVIEQAWNHIPKNCSFLRTELAKYLLGFETVLGKALFELFSQELDADKRKEYYDFFQEENSDIDRVLHKLTEWKIEYSASFIRDFLRKRDVSFMDVILDIQEDQEGIRLYLNSHKRLIGVIRKLINSGKKYENISEALALITHSYISVKKLPFRQQMFIRQAGSLVDSYLSGKFGDKRFISELKQLYADYMSKALSSFVGRSSTKGFQKFLSAHTELSPYINNLVAISLRISKEYPDTVKKIKEALRVLIQSNTLEEFNNWLYTQSEWNKEVYPRLILAGYDPLLWEKGLTKVVPAVTNAEEVSEKMKQQTFQLVEIALNNKVSVQDDSNNIDSFEKAREFALKYLINNPDISAEDKIRVANILQETEKLAIAYKAQLQQAKVTVEVAFDFLKDSYSGVGVPGCFNPTTGIHREMPLVHSLEADTLFLRVYKEGKIIANAVLILTENGVVVQPLYNSSGLSLDAVVFDALADLLLKGWIPAVLMEAGSAGNAAASGFMQGNHAISSKARIVEDEYYFDSGNIGGFSTTSSLSRENVEKYKPIRSLEEATEEELAERARKQQLKELKTKARSALFNLSAQYPGLDFRNVDFSPILKDLDNILFEYTPDKISQILGYLKLKNHSPPSQEQIEIIRETILRLREEINQSVMPAPSDLGAQVSNLRNLHILRLTARLIQDADSLFARDSRITESQRQEFIRKFKEAATVAGKIEAILSYLIATGEARVEVVDGISIIILNNTLKGTRLGEFLNTYVIGSNGGVKAINFKGSTGWVITGFEEELSLDTRKHEVEEVRMRRANEGNPDFNWIDAHNQAVERTGVGERIDKTEAQASSVGRQDELGAQAGKQAGRLGGYRVVSVQARDFIRDNYNIMHYKGLSSCEGHSLEVLRRLKAEGINARLFHAIIEPGSHPDYPKGGWHVWVVTEDGFIIDADPLGNDKTPVILRSNDLQAAKYKGTPLLSVNQNWDAALEEIGLSGGDIEVAPVLELNSGTDTRRQPEISREGLRSELGKRGEVALVRINGEISADKARSEDPNTKQADREIIQAARRGEIIELDISKLAEERGPFKAAFNTFSHIAFILRSTLNQPQYDVQEVLEELLSNAFVHGNKLDFSLPIFIKFEPTKDNNDVFYIEVFDAANNKGFNPEDLKRAKDASLTGQGRGVRETIEGQDWSYDIKLSEKGNGIFYTSVSVFPRRQSMDGFTKTPENAGGIDFRGLPIVVQPGRTLAGENIAAQKNIIPGVSFVLADKEWQEIEGMLNAGITPSSERIRDYLIKCSNENFNMRAEMIIACIADILREEEARCCKTEIPLKNMLVLLESGNDAQRTKAALVNIKVNDKEPMLIR